MALSSAVDLLWQGDPEFSIAHVCTSRRDVECARQADRACKAPELTFDEMEGTACCRRVRGLLTHDEEDVGPERHAQCTWWNTSDVHQDFNGGVGLENID